MGTSTSSRGPGGDSPLVPPWADVDDGGPGPMPEPQRFKEFRKKLGKFVANGDRADLLSAVGKYASTATGGSEVGPRRFGSMVQAGGALFDTLASLRENREVDGLDLTILNGQDTDLVIDALVRLLVPDDGDADRVRVAMNEALSECLEGYDEFDFSQISDELLVEVMLNYVTRCVFGQIILDSKDAFAKATTPEQVEVAEAELLALVKSATDAHMSPLLIGNLRKITRRQIEAIQTHAIQDVWVEWERYQND